MYHHNVVCMCVLVSLALNRMPYPNGKPVAEMLTVFLKKHLFPLIIIDDFFKPRTLLENPERYFAKYL